MLINKNIQGLRAIAVLIVVLSHSGFDFFAGGYVGVDVFFVISGFLITGALYREFDRCKKIDFMSFYAARARRLLPMLILVAAFALSLSSMFLTASEVTSLARSLPFTLTWTSNIYFAHSSFDYFDEFASKDLFLHTWSLAVEEQFYLLWPCLILGVLLANGRLSRLSFNKEKLLTLVMFSLVLIGWIISYIWTRLEPMSAFYYMPSRVWQFALGGGAFFLIDAGTKANSNILYRLNSVSTAFSGIALILAATILFKTSDPYPGWHAIVPSFGAFLVLLAYGENKGVESWLSNNVMVWLGDRSYSIYLWHWPIFVIGFSLGYKDNIIAVALFFALTIALSFLSFRFIELPWWKGRFSNLSAKVTILCGLLSVLALCIVYQYWQIPKERSLEEGNIVSQIKQDMPVIYASGCDTWYVSADVAPCVLGSEDATKTVVVFGDSIGLQWFSAISNIFSEPNWKLVVLTKSACPMVSFEFYYERIGKVYSVCSQWRESAIKAIQKLKPDVIVVGSSASGYEFDEEQWVNGSKDVFRKLHRYTEQLVVLAGTPSLTFDGPSCIAKYSTKGLVEIQASCSSKGRLEQPIRIFEYLASAAAEFDNVQIVNLNESVCPNGVCVAISPSGIPVFRDSQHLTDSFVTSQIENIKNELYQLSTLRAIFENKEVSK